MALRKEDRLTLLVLGLLAAICMAYSLPADFIDQSWSHFDVLRRFILWFLGGTAVRTILGVLLILVVYSSIYWLRIRNRQFIAVSKFRAWGDLAQTFNEEGMVARLRDGLMRLGVEMRASKSGLPAETASAAAALGTQQVSEAKPPILWEGGGLLLPGTYVTLQYQGISLEAVHTFIRRFSGREAVITGDLLTVPDGLLLVARTDDDGPWEVLIESSDSLELGLQQMALRIFTTFAQKFLKHVNTFVFLQHKAEELGEYQLLLRLANLEVEAAASASDEEKKLAQENLAKAHNTAGVILSEKGKLAEAIQELDTAIALDENLQEAIDNRNRLLEAINSQNPEE